MRLSATLLSTYRTCPRQYRYRYVDALPLLLTPPLAFGRVFHETLGDMHRQCVLAGCRLDAGWGMGEFRRRWAALLEAEGPLLPADPVSEREYLQLASELLFRYVAEHGERPMPMAVEFPFTIPWGDHTLVGYVDRVDETEDGVEVLEFKTGKHKPSRREIDGDLQLLLYTYGVGKALSLPVRRATYVHLRSGAAITTERDTAQTRQEVDSLLTRLTPAIGAGRHPPRSGWWCRFCDFRCICETEGPEEALSPPAPVSVPYVTATGKGEDPWPS